MKRTLLNKDFTEQVETILVPYFKEQGFAQSGIDNYRRYKKPFIHCIWLQERSDRKALCVNLGVHLDFLPLCGMISISKVEEVIQPACDITDRLTPKSQYDYWWPAKRAKRQVKSIKALFQKEGIDFFERYTSFPDVFESVTIEDIKSGNASVILPEKTRRGMAMFLARIYEHIGQKEKAVQFSEYGIETIKEANPRHIRPTKKAFEDIICRNR
jgi:hypothetical protein